MRTVLGNFSLKGERDYIQGTEMFPCLLKKAINSDFSKIIDLKFSINSMPHKDCDLIVEALNETIERPENYVCKMQIEYADGDQNLWLVESNREIKNRYKYNENPLKEKAIIDNHSIILTEQMTYTTIEAIVSLKKHMVESVLSESKGKWIFTRLDLKTLFNLETFDEIKIVLTNASATRLVKSEIHVNKKMCGYIFFTLI